MSDGINRVADELSALRVENDPVAKASREVLPYRRRVHDALGALRSLATDSLAGRRPEAAGTGSTALGLFIRSLVAAVAPRPGLAQTLVRARVDVLRLRYRRR